ncbi:MAG TPA: hypothetical protein VE570_06675, partial [Thermoleophilaceae bacterium]|nr:hypothetical protein [Thermoleophilaceae bacterium]
MHLLDPCNRPNAGALKKEPMQRLWRARTSQIRARTRDRPVLGHPSILTYADLQERGFRRSGCFARLKNALTNARVESTEVLGGTAGERDAVDAHARSRLKSSSEIVSPARS